jgi:hypothetical protein
MFHSSELLPGASPYRPAASDVEALLSLLDRLFGWSRHQGDGFATLTAAARTLADAGGLPVREL